jgi:hypothetical protein
MPPLTAAWRKAFKFFPNEAVRVAALWRRSFAGADTMMAGSGEPRAFSETKESSWARRSAPEPDAVP